MLTFFVVFTSLVMAKRKKNEMKIKENRNKKRTYKNT